MVLSYLKTGCFYLASVSHNVTTAQPRFIPELWLLLQYKLTVLTFTMLHECTCIGVSHLVIAIETKSISATS